MSLGSIIGSAFVEVRPDTSGFASTTNREVGTALNSVGNTVKQSLSGVPSVASGIGTAAGQALGDGFSRDAQGRIRNASGQFVSAADFAAGAGSAGSKAGTALGDGFYRDASGRLKESSGKFATDASKVGAAVGDGLNNGLRPGLGLAEKALIGAFAADRIAAFGSNIIFAAANFQSAMSSIGAVTGATGKDLDALKQKALQLGKDTVFSATEAAGAIGELAKAGVPLPDILTGAADAAVNLAAAGGVSLAEAATIASNALNQFGLRGADAGHAADLIAGAANASAIDVSQFGFSLAQVGAVARTVGLSFDDTSVAIAALGNAGIVGSDAGTSLKTMLLNLQPATKQAAAKFRELGIITATGANQFFDAKGKAKSLADISGVLQNALKGQTDAQKTANLQTLFGTDAVRAAAVLSREGAAGINELAAAMGKVSAVDVAKERLNNFKGALEQLKGSLETAAIQVGSVLLPPLQALATFASNNLVPVLAGLGSAFLALAVAVGIAQKAVIIGWITAAAPFVAIAAAVGLVVGGFVLLYQKVQPVRQAVDGLADVFQTAFGTAKDAFDSLVGGFQNPNAIVPAGLKDGTLVRAGATAGGVFDKIRTDFENVRKAFSLGFKLPDAEIGGDALFTRLFDAGQATKRAQEAITAGLAVVKTEVGKAIRGFGLGFKFPDFDLSGMTGTYKAFFDAGQVVKNGIDAILAATQSLKENIDKALIPVFQFLVEKAGQVGNFLIEIWPQVQEATTHVFNVIVDVITLAMKIVVPLVESAVNTIKTIWAAVGDDIINAVSRAWNAISGIISGVLNVVMGLIRTVLAVINGDWGKAWDGLEQVVRGVWDAIFAIIAGGLGLLKSALGAIASLGGFIVEGLFEGLKNGFQKFIGLLVSLADTFIIQPFKDVFGINSPSTLFAEFGGYLIEGLVNGLKAAFGLVSEVWDGLKSIVTSAVDAIVTGVSTAWNFIASTVSSVWAAVTSTIGDALTTVKNWIQDAWDYVSTLFQTSMQGWKLIISAGWEFIKTTVVNAIEAVRRTIESVWNNVRDNTATAYAKIKNVVLDTFDLIKSAVSTAVETVKQFVVSAWDAISRKTSDAWDAIKTAVGNAIDRVVQFARDLPGRIVQAVGDLLGLLRGKGLDLINGLRNGAEDAVGGLLGLAGGLRDRVLRAAGSFGSILLEAGKDIIRSLINGVNNMIGPLGDVLGRVTNFIKDHKGPIEKDRVLLKPAGEAIMQGLINAIGSQQSTLGSVLASVTANIGSTVAEVSKAVASIDAPAQHFRAIGINMGRGLISGIESTRSDLSKLMTGIAKDVAGTPLPAISIESAASVSSAREQRARAAAWASVQAGNTYNYNLTALQTGTAAPVEEQFARMQRLAAPL